MKRRFVVISGLPGSGKSRLAMQIGPLFNLAVIDKDDMLERLFDSQGAGDSAQRRTLSRESDLIFRREAEASDGAILVSFWRLPGMAPDSGTPTDWLHALSERIVNLHCVCPVEIAAARFSARRRHAGHLDDVRSPEQVLRSIQEVERLDPLKIGTRLSVDTSAELSAGQIAALHEKVFDLLE